MVRKYLKISWDLEIGCLLRMKKAKTFSAKSLFLYYRKVGLKYTKYLKYMPCQEHQNF